MTEDARPPGAACLTPVRYAGADVIRAGEFLDIYVMQEFTSVTTDPALIARGFLVIDLTAASFVDAHCMGQIFRTFKQIHAAGGCMGIACTRESILMALRHMLLNRLMPVCDDVDATIKAMRAADSRELA